MPYNLITILGPTASGKTELAANIASRQSTAVISADSRQVYRGMDIGTGKDLDDYIVDGKLVPYYLVDICNAGEKYNLYEFQKDFFKVYTELTSKQKLSVLCGGSGLYIEAVLKAYKILSVPVNEPLRNELSGKPDDELISILGSIHKLHNTSDTTTRKRLIRAIEIAKYQEGHTHEPAFPKINSLIIGVGYERSEQKERITARLKARLESGMVEEVKTLLNKGIPNEDLVYYGLEYKYITQYLLGQYSYNEMFNLLNIAIHQFSKRQMTWFRKMEREGFSIHWIDGRLPLDKKLEKVFDLMNN
jgi:tRNA dimethylallyltransferase